MVSTSIHYRVLSSFFFLGGGGEGETGIMICCQKQYAAKRGYVIGQSIAHAQSHRHSYKKSHYKRKFHLMLRMTLGQNATLLARTTKEYLLETAEKLSCVS